VPERRSATRSNVNNRPAFETIQSDQRYNIAVGHRPALRPSPIFAVDFFHRLLVHWLAMAEKSLNEIPRELRPLLTKGNDALSRDNFDYAMDCFSQILAREPALFDVRKSLRRAQQGKAAAGGGSGFFKKMLNSAGSSPQVAKGQIALRTNPAEALAIAEQILNGDPNSSPGHRIIVDAAMTLQMPQTAALSLDILVRNSPKDKDLVIKFAESLAEIGDVKRAERVLQEILKLVPNDGDLNQALKNVSAKRTLSEGGYDKAATGQASYRDMLRNEKEAKELEQEKRVVKSENVTDRLIGEYEQRVRTETDNYKIMRSLAELYTQKKEFAKALMWYEKVKASDVGNDPTLDSGIAATKVKQFDYEIEKLDAALPEYAERVAQLNTDKLAFQVTECQARVEKYPTDLAIRFEMGVLYFQAGKIAEAIKEFQRATGNPHKRIAAMNYLAQCFAKRKIFDMAADTLQDAIKEKLVFDDEKKELVYNLGSVFENMGKKADAIEQYKTIYKVDSSYRDVEAKMDAYLSGQ
jgi:tetratricopeptide (TPR) repeat protein